MKGQIVKQPDGRHALWSGIVDDFITVDYENAQEIIEDMVARARVDIEKEVGRVLAELAEGGKPYRQFTKSFEDCIDTIRRLHGAGAESLQHFGLADSQKTGVIADA